MFVVMLATFVVHEAAHAVVGATLGYDMRVTINGASPAGGTTAASHAPVISAAGPVITVAGALAAAAFGGRALPAFQIVFAALLMRILAGVASLRTPNDEMRVGLSLGLDPWTAPLATAAFLLVLTALCAARARPSLGTVLLSLGGALAAIAVVVIGEPYIPAILVPSFR